MCDEEQVWVLACQNGEEQVWVLAYQNGEEQVLVYQSDEEQAWVQVGQAWEQAYQNDGEWGEQVDDEESRGPTFLVASMPFPQAA